MTFSARPITLLTFLVLALAAPVRAQKQPVDPATAETVRRLLELTGAARMALQAMEAMVPAQRQAMPQVPAAFWDAFLAHARRDIPQLVDSLVPVYAAHFTLAQLQELVRFYESPLGRRLAEQQPLIAQESMQVGQRWGALLGAQVGDSLARAGVMKP
ncbi:MAG TPA: DUF2059 domain-containing protein [Gemmatimonadales bacterium]|jgi:hypothetical protein|nr:DUF2059 domain-containing protein [Gemmatimonadales bacterium]